MKTLIETSLFVAALVKTHAAHERSIVWLQRAQRREFEAIVSTHSLAELYATLTGMPLKPRITGPLEWRFIQVELLFCCEVIELSAADYRAVMEHLATAGLVGGIIYDALIAQAAVKARAERILTLNPKDFLRAYPGLAAEIVTP